jgi:hypothetical protein
MLQNGPDKKSGLLLRRIDNSVTVGSQNPKFLTPNTGMTSAKTKGEMCEGE